MAVRVGNLARGVALSDEENQSRGRALHAPGAEGMNEPTSANEQRRMATALDEARLRQQAIGVRLRQMFDDVVNEKVPDEFLEILRQADQSRSELE